MELCNCYKLTDGAVEALASHCPGLTKVNLCDCSNLTVGVVEALASLISQRDGFLTYDTEERLAFLREAGSMC